MVNSRFQRPQQKRCVIGKYIPVIHKYAYKSFILFVFLCLFPPSTLEAQRSLGQWQLTHSERGSQIWKLKNRRDVIGTFQIHTRKKAIDWKKIKTKKFFLNLTRQKQQVLSKIGISDWTVRKSAWKKRANHHELTLEGSYRDIKNQPVYFHEIHRFYKRKTQQILVSYPTKRPVKKAVVHRFIASVKK